MISYFDLHCDTLLKAYLGNYSLLSSPLQISFDKCIEFSRYIQIMAIWTENHLSDCEGFEQYKKIIEYAKNQMLIFEKSNENLSDFSFFLSVEDLRIIEKDLFRLKILFDDGVRFATLFWENANQFGGAWNSKLGLSNFGKDTILQMFNFGIIPDVSHSNERSCYDIIELCSIHSKTLIASHSNSLSVCNHKRNLSDEAFAEIIKLDGVVGISLCTDHLSNSGFASINDILKHIDTFLCLGGENHVCLGCDFDGISTLPLKIHNISDISKLYFKLMDLYGQNIADKIFFKNAYTFICKHLTH